MSDKIKVKIKFKNNMRADSIKVDSRLVLLYLRDGSCPPMPHKLRVH